MRAARSLALMASRVSLRACVRTRRPVVRDGVVRVVARRADGLRAAGLRFAAGLGVVLLVVGLVVLGGFSAIFAFPLPLGLDCSFRFFFPRFDSPDIST